MLLDLIKTNLHISDSNYRIIQIFRRDLCSEILLRILIPFKNLNSLLGDLIDHIIQSNLIQIFIFIPVGQANPKHFYRLLSNRNRRIVINFPKILMYFFQVILQNLYNLMFLFFHQRDIHFQLFHEAFIRLKCRIQLTQNASRLIGQRQHIFQWLSVKIILKCIHSGNLI